MVYICSTNQRISSSYRRAARPFNFDPIVTQLSGGRTQSEAPSSLILATSNTETLLGRAFLSVSIFRQRGYDRRVCCL